MFWVSFSVTVLLVIGIILAFKIDKKCISEFWNSTRTVIVKKSKQRHEKVRHDPIKRKLDMVLNGKKQNFMVRTFKETEVILAENNQRHRIRGVYILSGISAALGVVISIAASNIFLAPPLAFGAALVPTWIVKLKSSKMQKQLNSDLEVALSGITTSYMRNDNIILAAEENLTYLSGIVKNVVFRFVSENRLINSNIAFGIQKMKGSIDNEIFHEWCDALYQCQTDRSLKVTLFPIVNKFSETKAIQAELDTLMLEPFKETISIVIMVILSIPLMSMINKEWYKTLVNTVPGKIIVSLAFFAIVYAINKSVRMTAPIKRGDTK